ncbi:MAG: hypothetical protein JKY37_26520 [Nannocystaceae bacterium]|nr:hypothetical protein [Nannocystaceae bacterium]
MLNAKTGLSLVLLASIAMPACKTQQTDNPDVAASYRGNNQYEADIVTARRRNDYDDQGKGIDPKTLRQIEDDIRTVYERDLERCLEDSMAEHDTRFLRSVFTVEFHINPKGFAGEAKVLSIWLKKQNAKGTHVEELSSDELKRCIIDAIASWEFEPAPEVEYVHTYKAQLGEAF